MKKSETASADTTSKTPTAKSKDSSEPLIFDLPTDAKDVEMLRSLRRAPRENLLPYIDELLNPDDLGAFPPRRTTFAGYEPFRLEDDDTRES